MIETIIDKLVEKGLFMYAFILLLVWLILHYTLPYVWKIRAEKKEAREKLELQKKEAEIAVERQQELLKTQKQKAKEEKERAKSLPTYCPVCKKNTMVRFGVCLKDSIKYDSYKCPICGEEKRVPVQA